MPNGYSWDKPEARTTDVSWCSNCGVPIVGTQCGSCGRTGDRIASDVRPVFPEEKRLLEIFLGYPKFTLREKSVWDTNGSNVIIDGKTVRLDKGRIMQTDPSEIRSRLADTPLSVEDQRLFDTYIRVFAKANQARLDRMELEAFEIMNHAKNQRPNHLPVVSFSGGKDSTVVSDLVRRHYANQRIIHVFGNTTLEFPLTLEYIGRFRELHSTVPFFEARSRHEHDFVQLSEQIGPPSRVMRWCCTVFKTGPIGQVFDGLRKLERPILTFYGVRRTESNRRMNYKAISVSPKVSQQTVVSPVINWLDADIWLYILSHRLDFNWAYRLGFSRVGCWCCPSNSLWSFFLARIFVPELAEPWRDFLVKFAESLGKPDPVEYVDSGNWKARQGGAGLKTANMGIAASRLCGDDPNAKTYTLTRPVSVDLYEYFKPFGVVDSTRGRSILGEVFVLDPSTRDPMLILQGRLGSSELRVKVIESNNPTLLLQRVDCQIRKYQCCILCGGCPSVCPFGAITDSAGKYHVDSSKCQHCLKCITHFDTGCLVSKVLRTKRGGSA